MSEWFTWLGLEGQLATWLVASFLLYTLASQLAWQFQWSLLDGYSSVSAVSQNGASEPDRGRDDGLGRWVERVGNHRFPPWIGEITRLIYYLGIPFLVVISGLLGADLIGISGTDWIAGKNAQGFLWEDWARGLGLAAVAVLSVAGVWSVGRLVSHRAGLRPLTRGIPGPLWQRLRGALYDQIHWTFYRSAPILWLDDLYWGTFTGLALILLEVGLNPALWWRLKSPETAGLPLIRLTMAGVSALLFLATQNLWLTTGVHLLLAAFLKDRTADSYLFADKPAH
jgi:hypothetical protein